MSKIKIHLNFERPQSPLSEILQLSVGKLQILAPPNFLTDAAAVEQ